MPQNLQVSNPSTVYIHFTGDQPKVFNVFDENGDLYFFRYLDGRTPRIKFNVPDPGRYELSSPAKIVKIIPIEIPDSLPDLPPAERNFWTDEPEIIIDPELDDIARNYYELGKIVVGKRWLAMPKPIRYFILLHEKWHFFYHTEESCDIAATVDFLRSGYNRSTAFYAMDNYLTESPDNRYRVKQLFKFIQKTQPNTPLL